ncbi:unnamed protein product [Ostreobium quekettii]|uniref:Ribosomal protein S20 n=1 Tax=Ostreobium quekettii TaxID=121088 RepID=A0A8S1J888_9CHLO|nr:unnamed protein product [Ostreobium quekettii]
MMGSLTHGLRRLTLGVASRPPPTPNFSFSSAMRGQALAAPRRQMAATVAAVNVQAAQNSDRRQRRSEKQRIRNRARKSAVTTRMKKVFKALDTFKDEPPKTEDELKPVESLISEAFKEIDKAWSKGVLHKNTAARRKSRLSRAKNRLLADAGLIAAPKSDTEEA